MLDDWTEAELVELLADAQTQLAHEATATAERALQTKALLHLAGVRPDGK